MLQPHNPYSSRPSCFLSVLLLALGMAWTTGCMGPSAAGGPQNHTAHHTGSAETEVAVRGAGGSAEAALKNALANAVQQVVGAYVDQKTLVQNEAVIEDKILSVSAGFVQKYDEVRPPSQRPDGAWEVTVRAVVKKGAVGTALRTAGVVRVDADGRADWARQVTQIKSREDAMALIKKLVPELLPNLVQGRIIGHSSSEDPKTGEQLKCVRIEYRINLDWWEKEGYPAWDAALSALQLGSIPPLEMDWGALDRNPEGVNLHALPDSPNTFHLYRPKNASGTAWKSKRYVLPSDWMERVNQILLDRNWSGSTRAYGVTLPPAHSGGPVVVFSKLFFLGGSGLPLLEAAVHYEDDDSPGFSSSGYFPCGDATPFSKFSSACQGRLGPVSRVRIGSVDRFARKGLMITPFFSVDDRDGRLLFVGNRVTTQFVVKVPERVLAEMRSIELRGASFGVRK